MLDQVKTFHTRMLLCVALIASLVLLSSCERESATQASPSYHIGVITGIDAFDAVIDGIKAGLHKRGYREGDNVHLEIRRGQGDKKKMQSIAEELVNKKVDLIVTSTNIAAKTARDAAKGHGIPIVFTVAMAPVRTGVIDDLQQPSDLISGVRNPVDLFFGKRLEFLLQLMPDVKRIWVPHHPSYPTMPIVLPIVKKQIQLLGLEIIETVTHEPQQVMDFLASPQANHIDAILIMPDPVVQNPTVYQAMTQFAESNNIPIVANNRKQVMQGALLGYHIDLIKTGDQAAYLIDKFLQDKNQGVPIPVVDSNPILLINGTVAQRLNAEVDPGIQAIATIIR